MTHGEGAAPTFARLELRGGAGWSENFESCRAQRVGNARSERALGSDEDQFDVFIAAKRADLRGVARINRPAVRCSPVAGRDEDGITFALQSAGHGVFASAAAEHEDFHARANSKVSLGATPETSTGYFPVKQAVQ